MQRHLRLRQRSDFARLRTYGQRVRHHLVVMSYLANNLSHNRYGFIVGGRMGKAVQRNQIRRRMREAMRCYDSRILCGRGLGYDIVLVARKPLAQASFHEIYLVLGEMLQQAGLLTV